MKLAWSCARGSVVPGKALADAGNAGHCRGGATQPGAANPRARRVGLDVAAPCRQTYSNRDTAACPAESLQQSATAGPTQPASSFTPAS